MSKRVTQRYVVQDDDEGILLGPFTGAQAQDYIRNAVIDGSSYEWFKVYKLGDEVRLSVETKVTFDE